MPNKKDQETEDPLYLSLTGSKNCLACVNVACRRDAEKIAHLPSLNVMITPPLILSAESMRGAKSFVMRILCTSWLWGVGRSVDRTS